RHVVTDDVVKIERGLGLVDQRRDVADVDCLPDIDEFALLPQPVEELAEVLLLRRLRWDGWAGPVNLLTAWEGCNGPARVGSVDQSCTNHRVRNMFILY